MIYIRVAMLANRCITTCHCQHQPFIAVLDATANINHCIAGCHGIPQWVEFSHISRSPFWGEVCTYWTLSSTVVSIITSQDCRCTVNPMILSYRRVAGIASKVGLLVWYTVALFVTEKSDALVRSPPWQACSVRGCTCLLFFSHWQGSSTERLPDAFASDVYCVYIFASLVDFVSG